GGLCHVCASKKKATSTDGFDWEEKRTGGEHPTGHKAPGTGDPLRSDAAVLDQDQALVLSGESGLVHVGVELAACDGAARNVVDLIRVDDDKRHAEPDEVRTAGLV